MSMLPFVDTPAEGECQAVVVWLHGLGDSGHGFAPIVPELRLPAEAGIRFIFPHAPMQPVTINGGMEMRAWYDIKSMDLLSRADETGVRDSAAQVQALLDQLIAEGIPSERIVLAGFSQGGVVALHLLPRLPYKLAGVMALSTYMCAVDKLASEALAVNKATPVLMAHGQMDPVVPMAGGQQAAKALEQAGFRVQWHQYPMQHQVCPQEIADISAFLQQQLVHTESSS